MLVPPFLYILCACSSSISCGRSLFLSPRYFDRLSRCAPAVVLSTLVLDFFDEVSSLVLVPSVPYLCPHVRPRESISHALFLVHAPAFTILCPPTARIQTSAHAAGHGSSHDVGAGFARLTNGGQRVVRPTDAPASANTGQRTTNYFFLSAELLYSEGTGLLSYSYRESSTHERLGQRSMGTLHYQYMCCRSCNLEWGI